MTHDQRTNWLQSFVFVCVVSVHLLAVDTTQISCGKIAGVTDTTDDIPSVLTHIRIKRHIGSHNFYIQRIKVEDISNMAMVAHAVCNGHAMFQR